MPIRRVELGNELYDHARLIDRAIPTPEAYGRKASRWIRAIKRRFPHARVAAVGLGVPLGGRPAPGAGAGTPGCSARFVGRTRSPSTLLEAAGRASFACEAVEGPRRTASPAVPASRRRASPVAGWGRGLDNRVERLARIAVAGDMGERPLRRRVPAGAAGRAPGAPGGPPRAHQPPAIRSPVRQRGGVRRRQAGDGSVRAHGGGEDPRRDVSAAVGRPSRASAPFEDAPRFRAADSRPYRRWRSRAAGSCCSTSTGAGIASSWARGPPATGPWTRSGLGRPPGSRVTPGEVRHQAVGVQAPSRSCPARSIAWTAQRGAPRRPAGSGADG